MTNTAQPPPDPPSLTARPRRKRKPETPEHRARRLQTLAVQLADREYRANTALAAQTGQRPRNRGHVTPLRDIEDEEQRLAVQLARVERLEALLAQSERKRETRAKIILGATLLAEARAARNDPLLSMFVEILDRRLDRPRDRLVVRELLGLPLQPLKTDPQALALPDFDAMAQAQLKAPRRKGANSGGVGGADLPPLSDRPARRPPRQTSRP